MKTNELIRLLAGFPDSSEVFVFDGDSTYLTDFQTTLMGNRVVLSPTDMIDSLTFETGLNLKEERKYG